MSSGDGWHIRKREHPDFAAVINANSKAINDEDEAFAELLEAIPSATPTGFLAAARYTCDLTYYSEGEAIEGASPAYRTLAAFAGRPVFLSEINDEDEQTEDEETDPASGALPI